MKEYTAIQDERLSDFAERDETKIKKYKKLFYLNKPQNSNGDFVGYIMPKRFSTKTETPILISDEKMYNIIDYVESGWKIVGYIPLENSKKIVGVLKKRVNFLFWGIFFCLLASYLKHSLG